MYVLCILSQDTRCRAIYHRVPLTRAMPLIYRTQWIRHSHLCKLEDTTTLLHTCPLIRVTTYRSHPFSHTCDESNRVPTSQLATAITHASTHGMPLPNTMCQMIFTFIFNFFLVCPRQGNAKAVDPALCG